MTSRKVICFKCLHVWEIGRGKMIKHPRLRDKVEVCPKCNGWGWMEPSSISTT